ncbi:hydroxymyristoyl-ACP dehydratase [bacterium]|nr:hydroxymyristoyl-ACP dehydratase [bacterium]
MEKNLHGIVLEQEILKENQHVILKLNIMEESDFFDGHFPEFKLLPAVAQFEVITRLSGVYFGTKRIVPDIRRIKFSSPILPGTEVLLDMKFNAEKSTLTYKMSDFTLQKLVYSTGTFGVNKE